MAVVAARERERGNGREERKGDREFERVSEWRGRVRERASDKRGERR